MPPAAQQYTPSQILEAGRRAEAEGRIEYAIKFYRHLIDHHGGAPETQDAHDALTLIHARRPGEPPPPPPINGIQFRTGPPPVPAQDRPARQGTFGISIAPLDRERLPPLLLPPPRNAYRAGRIIAHLLTWAGGLSVLVGLSLAALSMFAPHLLVKVPPAAADWLSNPFVAPAAALGGVLGVLLGQLARAMLDQANAACDLAITARAQAERQTTGMTVQLRD